jgi:tol-pal system protein YbgF
MDKMKSMRSIMPHGLLLVITTLLLTTGCLTTKKQGDAMQTEIEALKAQQEVMQKSLSEREANMAEMIAQARKENEALKVLIAQAQETLQKNDAETGVDLQEMRRELDRLRGESEELDFRLLKMEQDLNIFKEDVDLRLQGAVASTNLPENATDLFKLGEQKLAEGDFRAARKIFETFISRHSDDTRVADAIYYSGESYFLQKQYVTSIYEYQKIIQNHARSKRFPDAALRIGQAFKALGKCEQAKPFFEAVVTEYKRSEAAKDAQAELDKGCK